MGGLALRADVPTTAGDDAVMRILARLIRGRKESPNWKGIVKEVERTIDATVKPEVLQYFERIVKSWKHKPGFRARKRATRQEIVIWVYPTGEHKAIWGYVSRGTRPHVIRPVKAQALHFRTGYQPRTRPGGQYRGPGQATGDYVFAQEVQHPGTKARDFERHIARWYRPKFRRHIENAMRRGARRA